MVGDGGDEEGGAGSVEVGGLGGWRFLVFFFLVWMSA